MTAITDYIKTHKKEMLCGVLLVLATATLTWYLTRPNVLTLPNVIPETVKDAKVEQKTSLQVVPKTSKNDNDLEVTQHYKANINGTTVEVPVVPKEITQDGTKAVVTQEVDMTKVINSALTIEREKVKQEYKKNWEVSTGIGSHEGDVYVPIELQRNYAPDKAISAEIHLDANDLVKGKVKVDGWEVKHTWKF